MGLCGNFAPKGLTHALKLCYSLFQGQFRNNDNRYFGVEIMLEWKAYNLPQALPHPPANFCASKVLNKVAKIKMNCL